MNTIDDTADGTAPPTWHSLVAKHAAYLIARIECVENQSDTVRQQRLALVRDAAAAVEQAMRAYTSAVAITGMAIDFEAEAATLAEANLPGLANVAGRLQEAAVRLNDSLSLYWIVAAGVIERLPSAVE